MDLNNNWRDTTQDGSGFDAEAYLRENLGIRNFQASDWPIFSHLICICGSQITSSSSRLIKKEFEAVYGAAQITVPMFYFDYNCFEAYPHDICGLFEHFGLKLSQIRMAQTPQNISDEVEQVIRRLALLLQVIAQPLEPTITYAQLLDELRQFVTRLHGYGYGFKSCET